MSADVFTDNEIMRVLAAAGIPPAYRVRERKLATVGMDDATRGMVAGWIDSVARSYFPGESAFRDPVPPGVYFCPPDDVDTNPSLDTFFIAAKGLLLKGVGVQVIPLADLMNPSKDTMAAIAQSPVLAIPAFYDSGAVRVPGPEESIYAISWIIAKAGMEQKIIMLQGSPPVAAWWWGRMLFYVLRRCCPVMRIWSVK